MSGPPAPPRTRARRRRDTEHRLSRDVDLWVATATAEGSPWLIPLSFEWDGGTLLLSTAATALTVRSLTAEPKVRLALGEVRDVVMIDGTVEVLALDAVAAARADRFAARTGFDPRPLSTPYRWLRVTPHRIQAWREENELAGRDLMREGRWLVPDDEMEPS